MRCAKSRIRRNEIPYPIWMKFCGMVAIRTVIICTNFGDNQLRSLGATWAKCSLSSLTLFVVLTTLWRCRASV